MFALPPSRRWLAPLAIGVALALTGCSSLGDGGTSPESSKKAAKGGQNSAEQSPTKAPAAFATIDQKLLPSSTAQLTTEGIKVTNILPTREMPGLAYGLDIVRGKILRAHSWAGGGELGLTSRVIASSSKAVGVATTTTGKPGANTAVVWYDPQTNAVFNSNALINPTKRTQLAELVGEAAGDQAAAAKAQLGKAPYPNGEGPSIGFNAEGDLIVVFQTVGGKQLNPVSVPADKAAAVLTEFGIRAKAATQFPTEASTPATFTAVTPAAVGGMGKNTPSIAVGNDCTRVKCVTLTFDDGPVPQTADLLDTLKRHKVPATFFLLGTSVDNFPKMVTKTAAAGMEIASHNQVHNQMNATGQERLGRQVAMSRTNIRKLAGQDPLFLRPPYGAHNKASDAIIGKNGMAVALWSVDTLDWKYSQNAPGDAQAKILSTLGQQIGNGGVVLMHDIHANSRASAAAVISKLKSDGYTLVSLAELAPAQYRYGRPFCASPALSKECGI